MLIQFPSDLAHQVFDQIVDRDDFSISISLANATGQDMEKIHDTTGELIRAGLVEQCGRYYIPTKLGLRVAELHTHKPDFREPPKQGITQEVGKWL